MELAGHAIVITGAGGGIGEAYAKAAAAIGAGIVVNDVRRDAAERVAGAIRAAGGRAVAEAADISNPEAANRLITRCIDTFGAITGLVNNAGVYVREPFEATSLDHLRRILEVNVIGTFNCTKAAIGPMLAQGRGSIVNIASGAQSGQPNLSAYGASKGAVASLTYGLACEFGDHGIRVNALSPLAFTAMSAHRPHLPAPEANVAPLLYLLSDRSRAINGQVIHIDGRKLSLMTHPANRAPLLESEQWTLGSVAETFDRLFAANQLPLGVVTYEVAAIT